MGEKPGRPAGFRVVAREFVEVGDDARLDAMTLEADGERSRWLAATPEREAVPALRAALASLADACGRLLDGRVIPEHEAEFGRWLSDLDAAAFSARKALAGAEGGA